MFEPALVRLLVITIRTGAAVSVTAGLVIYFSRDTNLTIGTSTGVGFLVGAAAGALFGIFSGLTG